MSTKLNDGSHGIQVSILLPHANAAWQYVRSRLSVYVLVCLCVCVWLALTFESFDLETSFLAYKYVFRMYRPFSYIKVIRSRSRSRSYERN